MLKSRSPLVVIFITIFIDLVGFGIVIPVLPLYAEKFGASETVVGLLLAVYSMMQFIFSPILGRISDRVGRRPVLLYSLIGTSIGFLVMGFAHTLWLLFVARIIDGITGGNISTAQAYIADVTPPDQRSRGMGLIGAAFGLGFIVGPALGGLLSQISPEAPFIFAAALAAVNATALYFLLPESLTAEHRNQAKQKESLARLLENSGGWQLGAVMATYFFATVAFAMLTATFALFTNHRFGYDATHNGYLFAYFGVLGAIIQGGLIGRLSKSFGDKLLAVVGTTIFTISLLSLPMSTSLMLLLITTTGVTIGNSLVTPTLNAMASKSVSASEQGRVLGVMSSAASLARVIGPALGGFLLGMDAHDFSIYGRTPYWVSGAIMLVALGLAATLNSTVQKASRETIRTEEQSTDAARK
jgi:DHA1 family tetracycline resistance protein-like MFS transporter